jgi:hypothetical protein
MGFGQRRVTQRTNELAIFCVIQELGRLIAELFDVPHGVLTINVCLAKGM